MSTGYSQTTEMLIDLPELAEHLPLIFDDFSLASTIGMRNKTMWYLLIHAKAHYTRSVIPKKSGGKRVIHAPTVLMKYCQTQILNQVLAPIQERLGTHVTAYRKNLSVKDAVLQHIPECAICEHTAARLAPVKHNCPRKGTHIQVHLKDFFPSTRSAWIRNYFKSLGYSHDVSGYLGSLMTVRDIPNRKHTHGDPESPEYLTGVPQGSPSAGAICNLVADHRLDHRVIELMGEHSRQHGLKGAYAWKYTRYSDDLSFTCGKVFDRQDTDALIKVLYSVITKSGYRANKKKTRVARGYNRRQLLGVVFNDKTNIRKDALQRLRAIVHNCNRFGFESQYPRAGKQSSGEMQHWLGGKINWVRQINPIAGERLHLKFMEAVETYGGTNVAEHPF